MSAEAKAWAAAVTAVCVPTVALGVLVPVYEAVIGAAIVAVVGYGLAGLMAWTDRGGVDV